MNRRKEREDVAMVHEAKTDIDYPTGFSEAEANLVQDQPSRSLEIMSLISRRSSPGVVVMGEKGDILLMNQQADEILRTIQRGRGPLSRTEEGKLIQRLHELQVKILKNVKKASDLDEASPICDLLPLRGTTFSLRGILLEGAGQEQAPVMILIEPIQERAASHAPPPDEVKLTKREEEICKLISRGLINKEIASALGIGLHTVKDHVKKIMKKLNAGSRAGIVAKIAVGGQIHEKGDFMIR